MQRKQNLLVAMVLAALLVNIPVVVLAQGSPLSVLHSFNTITPPINKDGANSHSPLLVANDGYFYGLTYSGGSNGTGTIYKLKPTGAFVSSISFPVAVGGINGLGAHPEGALIQGPDGALYGCTDSGGIFGGGVVFRYSLAGQLTPVAALPPGPNGQSEHPAISGGVNGRFYVTAAYYGSGSAGAIFTFTTALHNFTLVAKFPADGSLGAVPLGQPVQASTGDLYGVVSQGGANGLGGFYHITANGMYYLVHSFATGEGTNPSSGLTLDPSGLFYGVSATGGTSGTGCLYSISASGVVKILHSFNPLAAGLNSDGVAPAGEILDKSGVLYGVTSSGGSTGYGTFYSYTVTTSVFSVIHTFTETAGNVTPDGGDPLAGVTQDQYNNIYGTTNLGGVSNKGEVYEYAAGAITPFYSFTALNPGVDTEGSRPLCGITEVSPGVFEGTTRRWRVRPRHRLSGADRFASFIEYKGAPFIWYRRRQGTKHGPDCAGRPVLRHHTGWRCSQSWRSLLGFSYRCVQDCLQLHVDFWIKPGGRPLRGTRWQPLWYDVSWRHFTCGRHSLPAHTERSNHDTV